MCTESPLRVILVGDHAVVVDRNGKESKVGILFSPEVRVGQYVFVRSGFIARVLTEEELAQRRALFPDDIFLQVEKAARNNVEIFCEPSLSHLGFAA